MSDEYTSEERLKNLAYNYQTLRCWILNEIVCKVPDCEAFELLQKKADQILKDTE